MVDGPRRDKNGIEKVFTPLQNVSNFNHGMITGFYTVCYNKVSYQVPTSTSEVSYFVEWILSKLGLAVGYANL